MWIGGLSALRKPLAHLHTQFHRDIPWSTIDMDYMNLHQSAHGGREFGHVCARLNLPRKVIVGHWQDQRVVHEIDDWSRVAIAWNEMQHMKIARLGDNMRDVAVTEGDKVAAQMQFGISVNGYGLGELVAHMEATTKRQINELVQQYESQYEVDARLGGNGAKRGALVEAARIELGAARLPRGGRLHRLHRYV